MTRWILGGWFRTQLLIMSTVCSRRIEWAKKIWRFSGVSGSGRTTGTSSTCWIRWCTSDQSEIFSDCRFRRILTEVKPTLLLLLWCFSGYLQTPLYQSGNIESSCVFSNLWDAHETPFLGNCSPILYCWPLNGWHSDRKAVSALSHYEGCTGRLIASHRHTSSFMERSI